MPEIDGKPCQSETRGQAYVSAGQTPPVVEVEHGGYLLRALQEAGWHAVAPMGGAMPLSFADAHAFALCTEQVSEPWEKEALVKMSRAYCQGLAEGRNVFAIEPVERVGG